MPLAGMPRYCATRFHLWWRWPTGHWIWTLFMLPNVFISCFLPSLVLIFLQYCCVQRYDKGPRRLKQWPNRSTWGSKPCKEGNSSLLLGYWHLLKHDLYLKLYQQLRPCHWISRIWSLSRLVSTTLISRPLP